MPKNLRKGRSSKKTLDNDPVLKIAFAHTELKIVQKISLFLGGVHMPGNLEV
jgi:hypothetical protein